MKIVAVTQARLGSSRLPGKILLPIADKTILQIHLERIQTSEKINKIIVATTTKKKDEAIVEICKSLNFAYFRGSENDVLDRFYQATKDENPDYIVRVTSDCPLINGEIIDKVIDFTVERGLDYCSNRLIYKYPDGIVVEMFRFSALEKAWNEAVLKSEREHVAPFIWKNSTFYGKDLFTSANFCDIETDYAGVRLTIDEAADYKLLKLLIERFGEDETWEFYADEVLKNPDLQNINGHIDKNTGYAKSLSEDIITAE